VAGSSLHLHWTFRASGAIFPLPGPSFLQRTRMERLLCCLPLSLTDPYLMPRYCLRHPYPGQRRPANLLTALPQLVGWPAGGEAQTKILTVYAQRARSALRAGPRTLPFYAQKESIGCCRSLGDGCGAFETNG
jgi:hypothetical protein